MLPVANKVAKSAPRSNLDLDVQRIESEEPVKISKSWSNTATTVTTIVHQWSIEHFFLRPEKTGESINSSTFSAPGTNTSWYLSLYPYGVNDDYKDDLMLYLRLARPTDKDLAVNVKKCFKLYFNDNLKVTRADKSISSYSLGKSDCSSKGYPLMLQRSGFVKKILDSERKEDKNTLVVHCKLEIIEAGKAAIQQHEYSGTPPIPKCQLAEELGNMLENGTLGDAKVHVQNQTFKVHKAILVARSSVFAAMFHHDMFEKKNNAINIEDIEPDVFKEILTFIYTDQAPNVKRMASQLLVAANKYDLERLKVICEVEMTRHLNMDNVCEALVLADIHNAKYLKSEAMNMIVKQATEIMNLTQWENIQKYHPHLVSEAFRAQAIAAKK